MVFANVLVIVFAATGTIVAELSAEDILIVSIYDIGVLFAVDALKMGYQHWLKASGFGSYLDQISKDEAGAKVDKGGSYMGNLCCNLYRYALCLKEREEDSDEYGNETEAGLRRRRRRDAQCDAARGTESDSMDTELGGPEASPLLGGGVELCDDVR